MSTFSCVADLHNVVCLSRLMHLNHMNRRISKEIRSGVGQLTLVEHALCPLDARASVVSNLVHQATFSYSDKQRRRQLGHAQVFCPLGLSPSDEFYLWGLLSITLSNPQMQGQLHATRHYLLRRLGMIDTQARRGGRQYRDFSRAIERLSTVRYQCDRFYDPIRAEHRKVSFGFFSYSIPLDEESSRAWRFAWDPVFFEMASATGGSMRFDLGVYVQLDAASRRFYLFLSKLFYRRDVTPRLNVRQTTEQVLGVASTVSLRDKVAKFRRCISVLREHRIVRDGTVTRLGKGQFSAVLHRGALFALRAALPEFESPLVEPLQEIGLDNTGVNRILRRYDHRMVAEWVDITLAAKSRFGSRHFSKSATAYLIDNLKNAAKGGRTPPDWWHDIRKAETMASAQHTNRKKGKRKRRSSAEERCLERIGDVHDSIFRHFRAAGQPDEIAKENAKRFQRTRQESQDLN